MIKFAILFFYSIFAVVLLWFAAGWVIWDMAEKHTRWRLLGWVLIIELLIGFIIFVI